MMRRGGLFFQGVVLYLVVKRALRWQKNTPTVLYIWVNKTVELFFLEKSPRDENRPLKNYRTKPETGK